MAQQMHPAPLHVLTTALLTEQGLPPAAEWEHFMTGLTDEGRGRFGYDHPAGYVLVVETGGPEGMAIDHERSALDPEN